MSKLAGIVLCTLFLCVSAAVYAEEPANYTYSPKPPGTVLQSRIVYLAGEAMHSQWRAVVSRKEVGRNGSNVFYQYYFSLYRIDGNVYRLRYGSPKRPPLDAVVKAQGAPMWFPFQEAQIVGVGEFMGPGAQQVVVASHQTGADCGSARVDVFFYDSAMQMAMPTLSVENYCSLSAKIIHDAQGDALQLTGPYYAPNAATCCPTMNGATATLRFRNGTWAEQPKKYFEIMKSP